MAVQIPVISGSSEISALIQSLYSTTSSIPGGGFGESVTDGKREKI
jgi:hypothetical protein